MSTMNGRPLPGAWGPNERAALRRRPGWRPFAQSAANLATYAGLAWLVTLDALGPGRFLLWPIMGLVLAGCLAAAHDCFHLSMFESRRANRVVGAAWCTVVLTSFTAIKVAHMVHHRRTRVAGDSEQRLEFPTLGAYVRFLLPTSMPRSVLRSVRAVTGRHHPPYVVTRRQRRDARLDAAAILAWLAVAAGLTILAPWTMLAVYWGPLVFFLPMASAVALPEHYRCGDGPDTTRATRTTTSNGLVRMLIWNSNYHVEHHLFPWVPSCNLPRVHRAIEPGLEHRASGYLAFHAGVVRSVMR